MRRIVVAEHVHVAHNRHARRVGRDHDHRLLAVPLRILRVCLAHEDHHLAARIGRARGEPLAAVDHVFVAVAHDAGRDVGRIRGGHFRLGHGKGRADLAGQQRFQPGLLDARRGIAHQGLHIAGVGRRAVEDFGRHRHPAHQFAQRRVIEVGQAGAAIGLGQEQIPQAGFLGPGLEAFHGGWDDEGIACLACGIDLVLVGCLGRDDLGVDELLHAPLQLKGALGKLESHMSPVSIYSIAEQNPVLKSGLTTAECSSAKFGKQCANRRAKWYFRHNDLQG